MSSSSVSAVSTDSRNRNYTPTQRERERGDVICFISILSEGIPQNTPSVKRLNNAQLKRARQTEQRERKETDCPVVLQTEKINSNNCAASLQNALNQNKLSCLYCFIAERLIVLLYCKWHSSKLKLVVPLFTTQNLTLFTTLNQSQLNYTNVE